jgi:hypothetical protein
MLDGKRHWIRLGAFSHPGQFLRTKTNGNKHAQDNANKKKDQVSLRAPAASFVVGESTHLQDQWMLFQRLLCRKRIRYSDLNTRTTHIHVANLTQTKVADLPRVLRRARRASPVEPCTRAQSGGRALRACTMARGQRRPTMEVRG